MLSIPVLLSRRRECPACSRADALAGTILRILNPIWGTLIKTKEPPYRWLLLLLPRVCRSNFPSTHNPKQL